MSETMEMNRDNFVTCDLLDDNPESQVCLPNIEGKSFHSFGAKDKFCGEIVTVKCFEDNSRVKPSSRNHHFFNCYHSSNGVFCDLIRLRIFGRRHDYSGW